MNALVIGVGNRYRRDDVAGLAVAERVRGAGVPGVRVIDMEGDVTSLVDLWAGAARVFVVDAVSSGGEPGTVYRFDAGGEPAPEAFRYRGTHTLSIADVVELARAVDRMPRHLVTYGIEGGAFDAGTEMSSSVKAGALAAADRLLAELTEGGR
jgi:hydrogenase maturation protease